MTVQQIIDLNLWDKVCEYKGWNPWILNEGQIDENEVVTFDSEFKNVDNNMESLYQMMSDKRVKLNGNLENYLDCLNDDYGEDKKLISLLTSICEEVVSQSYRNGLKDNY